ncbi:hypothetical protein BGZ80_001074 [Entomortierella chlamydospora]|uniref:Methyltransferase domain-containing protein n=1 Tax=Entomortierella chlamydospora TaxID=101097 RepID=A0A9P6N260_9FUNG|nr:hypothetical protein BGZ79_005235 [Entomortierella chlamydospora]KAG0022096.1 hypothetical protein BGZ80_001074 [Entomortierella chlamydospora]
MDNPQGWTRTKDDYVDWAHANTLPHAQKAIEVTPVPVNKKPLRLLDVACGTGVVTETLAQKYPDVKDAVILATDFAQGMVDHVEMNKRNRGWENVEAMVMDATAMDLPDSSMDVIYCVFGVMLMPSSEKALSEMYRVLEEGGSVSIVTWHSQDVFSIFGEASAKVNASAQKSDASSIEEETAKVLAAPTGGRPQAAKTWMDLEFCQEKLEAAGFKDVKGFQEKGVFKIRDIKGYMGMVVRNPGMATMAANWSPEQVQEFQDIAIRLIKEKYGDQEEYAMNVVSNILYARK